MDFPKAYDSEPYDFQIAKLKIYSFDKTSLHLLRNDRSNWKERAKMGSSFRDCWEVICEIPQGLILSPLLFSISIIAMCIFRLRTWQMQILLIITY